MSLAWMVGAPMGSLRQMPLTREIARAIATDKADRQMRLGGRAVWSEADYCLAVATFEKLWPLERELETVK